MRQTLLNFEALPEKQKYLSSKKDVTTPDGPGRPPPSLPEEVLSLIFQHLGTIALKKFRLVCREWATIGASWLFHTAYLNSYKKSWAGLLNLANSEHAPKLQCIEWNPLVFSPLCVDASVWATVYKNFTSGLGHAEIIKLYNAYRHLYRNIGSLRQGSPPNEIAQALRNCTNCHRLVVSDGFQMVDRCDQYLMRGILLLPDVLNSVALWGLHPPYLGSHCFSHSVLSSGSPEGVLQTVYDALKLGHASPYLKCLHMNVLNRHLAQIERPENPALEPLAKLNPLLNFTQASYRLKMADRFGDSLDDDLLDTSIYTESSGLEFPCLVHYRSLETLCIDTEFIDPRESRSAWSRQTQMIEDETNSLSNSSATSNPAPSLTDGHYRSWYRLDQTRPAGCTHDVGAALRFYCNLKLMRSEALQSLTLTDVSINANALVCFLCSQDCVPRFPFDLRFGGTVVLYDLIPTIFFEMMGALNVRLHYNCRSTYYYPPETPLVLPRASPDYSTETPMPSIFCMYLFKPCRQLMAYNTEVSTPPRPFKAPSLHMPPCPSTDQQAGKRLATILRRPLEYRFAARQPADVPVEMITQPQYYRMRQDCEEIFFEWVGEDEAFEARTHPRKNTTLLMTLKIISEDYDGYGWEYEDYEWSMRMLERDAEASWTAVDYDRAFARYMVDKKRKSIQQLRWQRELVQQQALRVYETELLGLDIRERYFDLLARRAFLEETNPWDPID